MGSYSLMTPPLSINLTRSLIGMCIKSKRLVEFILKKGGGDDLLYLDGFSSNWTLTCI
jgi:hypothetical protein